MNKHINKIINKYIKYNKPIHTKLLEAIDPLKSDFDVWIYYTNQCIRKYDYPYVITDDVYIKIRNFGCNWDVR